MGTVATRTDTRLHITESFSFFGSGRLAGNTHAPMETPHAGVLICPSIGIDFIGSYRGEVVLARELASRGFATQRFHYRGTGHSDGDPAAVTFDSMCEDATAALAHLTSEHDVDRVAVIGTRIGALVAAAVGAATAQAPVVAVEPILQGRSFLREGFRARMMQGLAQGTDQPTSGALQDELEEQGSIDLLGYRLHSDLVRSIEDQRFAELLGTDPRPLFLVQLSSKDLRSALSALVDSRRSAGLEVDVQRYAHRGTWWFIDDDETQHDWIPGVADWLNDRWGQQ